MAGDRARFGAGAVFSGLQRDPYPSELEYFRKNPQVSGMATEDDRVILNPFSKLSAAEKFSVAMNEAARIAMRSGPSPTFGLTPAQLSYLRGTDYRNASDADKRATIAARILSGDPSAGEATTEQRAYVDQLRKRMSKDNMLRPDGTRKGRGWLGARARPDGRTSTEISTTVGLDGRETLIPLMVPGLTEEELGYLLKNDERSPEFQRNMPRSITDKAVAHAVNLLRQGKSPFAPEKTPPAFPARAAGNPFANQLREVFGKVRQRMQPDGLQGGQAQAPGARFQALADNAPVGSVGAPGGIQRPGRQPTAQDGLSALLTGGAMVPGPVGDVAGPLADAYMYATEPESRTLGNAAMSALGVLPGIPSMAGIFVGKKSGVWDAVAARRAEELEAGGVPPEQIWSETGTWRGPDGQWRQEIDDRALKLKGMALKEGETYKKFDFPMWMAAEHPELAKSYEGVGSTFIDSVLEGAEWNDAPVVKGTFWSDAAPSGGPRIDLRIAAKTPAEANEIAKSMMLHEFQHMVQGEEGWARGGSVSEFDFGPMFDRRAADLADDLSEHLTGGPGAAPKEMIKHLHLGNTDEMMKIVNKYGFGSMDEAMRFLVDQDAAREPFGQYKRLAGEAEARATEARRMMDAKQRRATFPPLSYDVPIEHLILRDVVQSGRGK